ncbi:MAG: nucleotidyltransferase domain-containing protein [Rhodoferax sp.]|uniref:nucleotidyltransferase family protein n=1 Tax=Rhodoferax sp. TaxID=50421 RepID=UPI003266E27C
MFPAANPSLALAPSDWAEVLRILREQVPQLEVWAFGSRARRTAKPYSDLDLAIISRQPLSLEQLASIHDAFDTSDLPVRVDIVDWASTSEAFRAAIARDKVVVQLGAES